jgi:hypothetical protein
MMFTLLIVALAVFVQAVSAALVRMEPDVNTFSSSLWLKEKIMALDHTVNAMFVLKHDSAAIKDFEKNLIEISTPSNPRYGQWLTVNNF